MSNGVTRAKTGKQVDRTYGNSALVVSILLYGVDSLAETGGVIAKRGSRTCVRTTGTTLRRCTPCIGRQVGVSATTTTRNFMLTCYISSRSCGLGRKVLC